MKIILEHNGTPSFIETATRIQEMLEFDLGHKVEQVIGSAKNQVILYDDSRNVIGTFNNVPTLETLSFYMRLSETED